MRKFLPTLVLTGVLALGLAACGEESQPQPAADTPPVEGAVAPTAEAPSDLAVEIAGTTIAGESFKLSEQRGLPVVVNFFATWCPPCREEIPDLVRLAEEFSGKLVLVGVSEDQNGLEVLPDFIKEHKISYPVIPFENLMNPDTVLDAYPHDGIPMTFVIDAEGRVVEELLGGRDYAAFRAVFTKYVE